MKRTSLLVLALLIGTIGLTACGKKGKLIPPKEWKKAEAPQDSAQPQQKPNG